ncbi:major coat protein [Zoogloea sp.]|uniref:major coat protein n=1 Tax=Zoogloea sp. TaxID=49181 RepID=UPI0035AD9FBB
MQVQNAPRSGSIRRRVAQAVAAGLSVVAVQAHAELPAAATTAFTSLKGDAEALIVAAWPVVAAITVGFVLISLFKRAAGKV